MKLYTAETLCNIGKSFSITGKCYHSHFYYLYTKNTSPLVIDRLMDDKILNDENKYILKSKTLAYVSKLFNIEIMNTNEGEGS